ncbi:MAG: adenylate kinase [Actinomycetota bacterium]|nr:adenylate kinase [Actinomycetota bacterium]
MRLLIMGPPGAGKGTQASRIAEQYSIPAISTGDIFRTNIKNKSELGLRVEAILGAGGYVPDEVTNDIVRDRLTWDDAAGGWLLDGYPRTAGQVDFLDAVLQPDGDAVDAVISLTVDEDALVERLIKRARTDGRSDDTEEVIRERQAIYRQQTAPLLQTYGERGIVVEVDGMGAVDEVTSRLVTAIDGMRGSANV